MIIIALLSGLVLGAVGGWLALRPRLTDLRAESDAVRSERDSAATARDSATFRLIDAERELAEAKARLSAADEVLETRMRDAIRTASAEAYTQTNASFLELAGTKLGVPVRGEAHAAGQTSLCVGVMVAHVVENHLIHRRVVGICWLHGCEFVFTARKSYKDHKRKCCQSG
jgi:hypothetical protein